ncbi:MAG: xanthine permease [Brevinemataceae bacterium]
MTNQNISYFKPQKGDINGFFGLFLNNLTNLIVLTSLLFSIGLPSNIILRRIIPGSTLAIFVSSVLYSYFAYRLAKQENRTDVTALPTGLSVPHMFLIVYIVILPVFRQTGDATAAWLAAVAWTFFEGIVEILGAIIGPFIRKNIPRAALLGSLAGVSLVYIAFRPMYISMQFPFIAFVSFAFIMLGWINKNNYFGNLPVGLIVIIMGIITGVISNYIDFTTLANSTKLSFYIPQFVDTQFFTKIIDAWPYIATALPLGIYNFLETMDNLESASAAGDNYNTRTIMLSDGFTSILGCFFGAAFPTALYIGHPGWKRMGGRQLYTFMSGTAILILGCLGIMEFFSILIPEPAMLPILAFIGLSIASQSVNEIPKNHTIAVFVAIFPWLAEWVVTTINTTVNIVLSMAQASDQIIFSDIITQLEQANIAYSGMKTLGSGAILVSIIWSSLTVFIVDGELAKAVKTTILASALSFFGIIHSANIGINVAPQQSFAYLVMGIIIFLVYFKEKHKIQIK